MYLVVNKYLKKVIQNNKSFVNIVVVKNLKRLNTSTNIESTTAVVDYSISHLPI